MDELTLQSKQEEPKKSTVENSQNLDIENMLLSNSEAKPLINEENVEVNEFSDANFVDVHETKNEMLPNSAESDIKSELEKNPLSVKCTLCDACFSVKTNLNKHIKYVHEKKKPFECHICDANFASKQGMNTHTKSVHEGEKPFKCDICDYISAKKSHVKTHTQSVHEKKKPFKCSICDYSFAQKQQLKRHIQLVHEKKKLYKCNICYANFSTKQGLNLHIESIHYGLTF